ncbi:MAG: hypothetical protein K2I70_03280, partial [Bacilli bacterium]|nr:hypothetical protein [Bacilli bacterium]
MANIDKTIKNGRIMGKPVIDNCTIYRLLDGIDKDTQRELCLKALSYSQGEDMEISNEGEKLRSN